MSILFYDTETTGLPEWGKPSNDPAQPHIVQVAAGLCDMAGKPLESYTSIVRPDGWTIPQSVSELHGITTERAMDEGIPVVEMMDRFFEIWGKCSLRVAHNEPFDARMFRIGLKRLGREEMLEPWKTGERACTMRLGAKIMKKAPTARQERAGYLTNKNPTLNEAHRFFVGRPVEDAHTATGDVQAVRRIYFAIQNHEKAPEGELELDALD